MSIKDKVQCAIRLYKDDFIKVKTKVIEDNISLQVLGEVLYGAYLKNNKEIMRLVKRRADERHTNKRKYSLDEVERDELLRLIEKEYSPLKEAIQEIENEE
jgi:hypothetical protein